MKRTPCIGTAIALLITSCGPQISPEIVEFSKKWEIEEVVDSFSLKEKHGQCPDVMVGGGTINVSFLDGSFISTKEGKKYSGFFIFNVSESNTKGQARKIFDDDGDFLPDRIEDSNGVVLVSKIVPLDGGFNIEFKPVK